MKALITLLLLGLAELGLPAQETNGVANFDVLGDRGREISSRLAAYDQKKDYDALYQVPILLASTPLTNSLTKRAFFLAHLEVLSRSLLDSDEEFDRTNPGTFINNVMPPIDPVERKKYDERMAENERVRDGFNRQFVLRKAAQRCTLVLTTRLKAMVNARDSKSLEVATNAIARKIKDAQTKDTLFRAIADASAKLEMEAAR